MIDDILTITKYTVFLICSFYGFIKLAKIKPRLINLLDILIAATFATGLYYATKKIRILIPFGFLLITCLYSFIRYKKPILNTATASTISCGITTAAMVISALISLPVDYLTFRFVDAEIVRTVITVSVICILQLLFIFLTYRIKRLKSGLFFQNKDENLDFLLLFSILSIFLMTLFYAGNIANSPTEIIVITITFCGLGLIVWWKKHVTNNYQKQLYSRNESLYERRIEEYEKERAELLDSNAELSKIIHRDNKLIPAMIIAVKELINSSTENDELKNLLSQFEELSSEHKEIINSYQAKSNVLPKTDNITIDAVIHYLYSKALQNHTELNVRIDNDCIPSILSQIPNMIDLTTILCDLGENAIIATRKISDGKIGIAFELSNNKTPSLSFYDNGALFDEKVIANMGRKRITTHQGDGGSGIGLMTLFEILEKYNASYLMNEKLQHDYYTKYIKILFDKLHTKTIMSNRETVKKICQARQDLEYDNR